MNKRVNFIEAVAILGLMMLILGLSVIAFGLSPQVPVLSVTGLLFLFAAIKKIPAKELMAGIEDGVKTAIVPLFLFLLIGTLIAVWIQAGIIPSLMVLGFKLVNAHFFVPSVFIVCALVGVAIGSGFTTISTIGLALFGMGETLQMNSALVAGAIISGAIFGDKMSPLSDSTNLASAVAGSDLFAHIKNMLWTTIPAFIVSLVAFLALGMSGQDLNFKNINVTVDVLRQNFTISWWAALPVCLMFICAWKKIPAIPTLFLNIAIAGGMIWLKNPHFSLKKMTTLIQSGFVAQTGNRTVDALLSRGGIDSMMSTVALIIMTLALGGILMRLGVIEEAMSPVVKKLTRPGQLIIVAILAGIGVNLFVGEQYLSVILPGNAFKPAFKKLGLDPLAQSRVLEDGGSVINYLVPWGVAASFAASTLGVSVLAFLPFTVFAWSSPLFSILSGILGIGLKRQTSAPK
ncbi:putative tyrosine permease, NhaC family [Ligilactobacillus sp. WC1T17]|uniref:Tyrosine permease, NhaC family n=1 Tax=Ligilactobacillus ruminis TaxID=1623 RepID=A0ABY1AD75_9LACO|nr:putative tyrosine permease, NhaC family [Ligilactobacillus ruminis]